MYYINYLAVRLAEQYIEARGVEYGVDSNSTTAAAAVPARTPSYGEKQCYICHRTNHIARDCFYREQHPRYNSNAGGEYSQSNRVFNADSEKEQIGSSMIDEYIVRRCIFITYVNSYNLRLH